MAVFDLHHPWLFVFGVLGNIISICVYLSPMLTFSRIIRTKSTMGFQSLPYVVALFSAMLWMYYAFLKKNDILLISINSFGCFIETIYISIFLIYASKETRSQTLKLLISLVGGLYTMIFLGTLFPLNGSIRVQVVGWICVAVSVAVFAAPLSIVFQVVRTKSVEFMPFTLSFFLTLSAIMWFGYGLLQKDICVALPNILGFFLGLLQMLLYAKYRNIKPASVPEKKVAEHVINVVALEISDQVHPIIHSHRSEDIINKLEEVSQAQHEEEEVNGDSGVINRQQLPLAGANGGEDEERHNNAQPAQGNNVQHQIEIVPVLVVCTA